MEYKLGVLKGDGIGPEIVKSALDVLEAGLKKYGDIKIRLEDYAFGWEGYHGFKSTLPEQTVEGLKSCHGAIVGPASVGTYPPDDKTQGAAPGILRSKFDLYANIRIIKTYNSIESPLKEGRNINIVIVRQNTEGFYPDRNLAWGYGEFVPKEGLVISLRVISEKESTRIAKRAFALAKAQGFQKVTAIHKGSLRMGDGLFLKCCREVSKEYKNIPLEVMTVDNCAMQLIMKPQDLGVIVATNLFGDILSEEAAGLIGGLGLAPSINEGDEFSIANVAGGSAPDIAGKNIANPCAMILSLKMLLEWLGLKFEDSNLRKLASNIDEAVTKVLNEGKVLTPDLKGKATTEEMTAAICKNL